MRTVKFTSPDQVNEKVIKAWVKAAVALDRSGVAPRAQTSEPVATV
jgi:hypothetical protein